MLTYNIFIDCVNFNTGQSIASGYLAYICLSSEEEAQKIYLHLTEQFSNKPVSYVQIFKKLNDEYDVMIINGKQIENCVIHLKVVKFED